MDTVDMSTSNRLPVMPITISFQQKAATGRPWDSGTGSWGPTHTGENGDPSINRSTSHKQFGFRMCISHRVEKSLYIMLLYVIVNRFVSDEEESVSIENRDNISLPNGKYCCGAQSMEIKNLSADTLF